MGFLWCICVDVPHFESDSTTCLDTDFIADPIICFLVQGDVGHYAIHESSREGCLARVVNMASEI